MEAGNELLGILAGLQDDVAWTFVSWSAGGLTSVRKKNKKRKATKEETRKNSICVAVLCK